MSRSPAELEPSPPYGRQIKTRTAPAVWSSVPVSGIQHRLPFPSRTCLCPRPLRAQRRQLRQVRIVCHCSGLHYTPNQPHVTLLLLIRPEAETYCGPTIYRLQGGTSSLTPAPTIAYSTCRRGSVQEPLRSLLLRVTNRVTTSSETSRSGPGRLGRPASVTSARAAASASTRRTVRRDIRVGWSRVRSHALRSCVRSGVAGSANRVARPGAPAAEDFATTAVGAGQMARRSTW